MDAWRSTHTEFFSDSGHLFVAHAQARTTPTTTSTTDTTTSTKPSRTPAPLPPDLAIGWCLTLAVLSQTLAVLSRSLCHSRCHVVARCRPPLNIFGILWICKVLEDAWGAERTKINEHLWNSIDLHRFGHGVGGG